MFKAKNVSRKKKKKLRIKVILFIFFFFFSYVFSVKYIKSNRLRKSVLDESVNYVDFNAGSFLLNRVSDVINKPVSLLNDKVKNAVKVEVKNTKVSEKESKKQDNVVPNFNSDADDKVYKPVVYVYNTHQGERYSNYSVYEAAEALTDKLSSSGIDTYFESQSVNVFLQSNNLKYYKSYTVSRNYMNDAISKYPSLTYFFDIHRDSLRKEKTTLNTGGKSYAKILFLVGTDNPSYEENLKTTNALNMIIESKVKGLSRGVMQKGGKGVDGVYNQDASKNVFLLEIGGTDNTKEEVENTMEVLYQSVTEYVRGAL